MMLKTMVALTVLNVVVSSTTLAIVVVGGKKMREELEETKSRLSKALHKMKAAINAFDL